MYTDLLGLSFSARLADLLVSIGCTGFSPSPSVIYDQRDREVVLIDTKWTQFQDGCGEPDRERGYNRLGHQGLILDRIDADCLQPPLAAAGVGLYQNRNRTYAPTLGRFLQRDPNESGANCLLAIACGGQAMSAPIHRFDLRGSYHDGANLYLYALGRPTGGGDPLGLFFFGDVLGGAADELGRMGRDVQQLGAIQAARMALMRNMAGIYFAGLALADAMMADATGAGIGGVAAGGVGLMAYETAAGMKAGGQAATELLELTASNFRANLSLVTGVADNWLMKRAFQAHHMIPQEWAPLLRQLGIEDMLHNPLLGQWVETAEHAALHNAGYNGTWKRFLDGLINRGASAEEARLGVLTFIREEIIPGFEKYGLVHVP